MEGDDRQSPPGLQQFLCRAQALDQFLELAIDENSQGLERPGGGVDGLVWPTSEHRLNELGQFARPREGLLAPAFCNGSRDGMCAPLFAEYRDHAFELAFLKAVDDIGGAWPRPSHAHVERSVLLE